MEYQGLIADDETANPVFQRQTGAGYRKLAEGFGVSLLVSGRIKRITPYTLPCE